MKKHDEGYVLAYVVVIMAVLTTIALSVMSVSLSNLQKQRAEVERMQDKYAAEGAIEQAIETLEGFSTFQILDQVSFGNAEVKIKSNSVDGVNCDIVISATHESVQIICEAQVTCELLIQEDSGDSYGLKNPKVTKILSYQISTVEVAEGGGESVPK